MEELRIKSRDTEIVVTTFDSDKEIEIGVSNGYTAYKWLNFNETNQLINHLAKCLKAEKEPVELLSTLQSEKAELVDALKEMNIDLKILKSNFYQIEKVDHNAQGMADVIQK